MEQGQNPAGSSEVIGVAININGEIVGELYPTAGASHAAKFSGDAWTDLDNLPGAQGSEAPRPMLAAMSTPCCSA